MKIVINVEGIQSFNPLLIKFENLICGCHALFFKEKIQLYPSVYSGYSPCNVVGDWRDSEIHALAPGLLHFFVQ